jgi:uncharacterized small protein (DUF1192 family)
MATTSKSEKIFIGIDEQVVELTGVEKEIFLEQRAKDQAEIALLEAEQAAKQEARTSALTKLATIAGLNEEEMTALGL